MPAKCFVPGCTSGYKTCSASVSMMKPPSDPLLLDKWRKAIPRADRVLDSNDRVCELHFASEFVERTYRVKVGNEWSEFARGKPKLVHGAVPHLFPNCPAYLSKKAPRKRAGRGNGSTQQVAKRQRKNIENCCSPEPQLQAGDDSNTGFTFELLVAECATLCPATWSTVCINDDYACFGKLEIVDGQMMVMVSVSVSRMMDVKVFFKGLKATLFNYSHISSRDQLTAVFRCVDRSHECKGNPDRHLMNAIATSRVGLVDSVGVWRHTSCTRLTVHAVRCAPCRNFRRILQTAAVRRNIVKKLHGKAVRARTVNRLQKRVNVCRVMAARLKHQLKSARSSKFGDLTKELAPNQQLAVRHCFRQLLVKSSTGMRYDSQWILGCILLRIKSPKAYVHLRDNCFLSLPSVRTLSRYIDVIRAETGVSSQTIELLSRKVTTSAERHGILMFDEIHLREGMKFSSKTLEFEGLVDFGEFTLTSSRKQLADTGLVFMYRPVRGSWVQTVGLFLSKGPTPASMLSKLLLKVMIALESHGLLVDGLVCDGSTTNRGVWKEFGICGLPQNLTNSVRHPLTDVDGYGRDQKQLYFFSDYVHLFKCIRNNLLNRRVFRFPEGEVLMSHFVNLLKVDTCHGGLRAVPKLTANHVEPNNFQRMNVRLAVQLFSNSVADGLSFYKTHGAKELASADITISFVRRMNKLFDVLNAKLPSGGLRLNTENMRFIEDCMQWLDNWESFAKGSVGDTKKFLSPSTAAGLRVTLKSTLEFSQFLLQSSFDYVLTSRFSQDPLEHFFGLIRHAGGCDDHPTTVMFMQLYRLLSVYSLLRLPKRHCAQDCNRAVSLPHPSSVKTTHCKTVAVAAECLESLAAFSVDDDVDPSELPEPSTGTAKDNIIFYISGFVVRRIKRVTGCDTCIRNLTGEPSTSVDCVLLNVKLRGALHWPSTVLFNCLRDVENTLCSYTADRFTPFMFTSIIEDALPAMLPVRATLCDTHSSMLVAEILVYYISTRLHWHAKAITRETASRKLTKNNRKKAKLS